MPYLEVEPQILIELEADFTQELAALRQDAVLQASAILGINLSLQQFHARIGHWNNELVDAVRSQFTDPNDFFARWLHGLRRRVQSDIAEQRRKGQTHEKASYRLVRLMQNEVVRNYTYVFLVRNFYRNLIERTRAKPDDHMWSLWFGNNRSSWGLLIAPTLRDGSWTNDKSEMRRAQYDYWTVGHVCTTGLVDPDSDQLMTFSTTETLTQFYESVLRRESISQYEREIGSLYVDYLRDSTDVEAEPFLIPELRYAGLETRHMYRLDFSVLNPHTMSFTGFELSPHSTHLAVTGTRTKTQGEINAEVSAGWEREMEKRNQYFATFGITTVTFTDRHLQNIGECFASIREYLAERPDEPVSIEHEIQSIETMQIPS